MSKYAAAYLEVQAILSECLNMQLHIWTVQCRMLSRMQQRGLTMMGRVLIVKTLGLSKLLYNASVLTVPAYAIKEVNRECYKFIWNYKLEKIKRKTLIGDYEEGGLNVLDFEMQVHALKVKWINRLLTEPDHAWAHVAMSSLENICSDVTLIFSSNVRHSKFLPGCQHVPSFYIQMLNYWFSKNNAPQTDVQLYLDDILKQKIWGNQSIMLNNKVMFINDWIHNDIIYKGHM